MPSLVTSLSMDSTRSTAHTRLRAARDWLAEVWRAVRTVPHLSLLASALGLAGSLALAWQMGRNAIGEPGAAAQVVVAGGPKFGKEFLQVFIEDWLGWTLLLLSPAFILGLIRLRGREIVLPVALASGIILVWWLFEDVAASFGGEFARSQLGEDRSLAA